MWHAYILLQSAMSLTGDKFIFDFHAKVNCNDKNVSSNDGWCVPAAANFIEILYVTLNTTHTKQTHHLLRQIHQ